MKKLLFILLIASCNNHDGPKGQIKPESVVDSTACIVYSNESKKYAISLGNRRIVVDTVLNEVKTEMFPCLYYKSAYVFFIRLNSGISKTNNCYLRVITAESFPDQYKLEYALKGKESRFSTLEEAIKWRDIYNKSLEREKECVIEQEEVLRLAEERFKQLRFEQNAIYDSIIKCK